MLPVMGEKEERYGVNWSQNGGKYVLHYLQMKNKIYKWFVGIHKCMFQSNKFPYYNLNKFTYFSLNIFNFILKDLIIVASLQMSENMCEKML